MSSQDSLTVTNPWSAQGLSNTGVEFSDSLLFNDGREGGAQAGIVLLPLFIIMSK